MDSDWVANVSDHFAITWNVNCKMKNEKVSTAWRLNSKNWDDYRSVLNGLMQFWRKKKNRFKLKQKLDRNRNRIEIQNDIDDLTNLLVKNMRVSSKLTIGIKKYDENSKNSINSNRYTIRCLPRVRSRSEIYIECRCDRKKDIRH